MPEFNKRLRHLRKEYDYTQEKLAELLGISKSSINMYERGEREPNFEMLETIADFFNVDMNYLLGNQPIKSCISLESNKDKLRNNLNFKLEDSEKQLIKNYRLLDLDDKAEIRVEIKHMLKSNKYKKKNNQKEVTPISESLELNYNENETKLTELTEEEHKKAKEEAKKLLEGSTPIVSIAAFGGDGVESTILTEEEHKKAREEARKLLEDD